MGEPEISFFGRRFPVSVIRRFYSSYLLSSFLASTQHYALISLPKGGQLARA
jgi:hypothetical protein